MQSFRYFCPFVTKFGFYRWIFIEVAIIKYHGNPPSGSRADTCGRTDMTKVIGAFRNYAKVSEVINEIWQIIEDYEGSQIFHTNRLGNSNKMMTKKQMVEMRSNKFSKCKN